jgi:hypothetical protein
MDIDARIAVALGGALLSLAAIGCGGGDSAPAIPSGPSTATTMQAKPSTAGSECQPVGKTGEGPLQLCWGSEADGHGRFVVDAGSGQRELEIPPPGPTPTAADAGKAGHWAWAALAPDGHRLLAQWSSECEVPIAFFADLQGGDPEPVTGEEDWAESPESTALGWTTDGRAILFLPKGGACGSGESAPGVYLYSQAGEGDLVFPGRKTSIVGAKRPRSVAALRQAAS